MHLRTPSLTACLGFPLTLVITGCTVHAHSEFHTGTAGQSSAGAETRAPAASADSGAHHEGRHSPAGRDNVVRVTSEGEPAAEQGDGTEAPPRTVVHPTGDVPSSASAGSATSAGARGGSPENVGESGQPAVAAQPEPGPPAPDGEKPAEEAGTGKGSRKSPSEPHVATPSRKPRKVHRTSEPASTNKEGGHE